VQIAHQTRKGKSTFITINVSPVSTPVGYFDAHVDGAHLCRSRQPLLDGARHLLRAGHPADAVVVMKRAGSPIVALSSTIGKAAGLTVSEEANRSLRFKRWRPLDLGDGWTIIAASQNSVCILSEEVAP
jgi:hypothetical protein